MKNPFRRQVRIHGKFTSLKSSCIGNINYDPIEETMEIIFSNPELGKWRYYNVPALEVAGFETSSSQGEYFNANIRDVYDYERVY